MEENKKTSDQKIVNKGINPVLNDIISVLFLPAGLFLMLINPSMPRAYKIVIATLIVIGGLWIIYSIFNVCLSSTA